MDTQIIELLYSFKELTNNLMSRIDPISEELKKGNTQRLVFWLEDFSTFTEAVMFLTKENAISFDLDSFNEKAEILINMVEENDLLFVSDLLQYDFKPLLSYLNGCIING